MSNSSCTNFDNDIYCSVRPCHFRDITNPCHTLNSNIYVIFQERNCTLTDGRALIQQKKYRVRHTKPSTRPHTWGKVHKSKHSDQGQHHGHHTGTDSLKVKNHTAYVINKLNGVNWILRKLRNQIGTRQKVMIYNALFRSNMEYGVSIWARGSNLDRIEKLQKRAVFAVDGPTNKRHSEPVLKRHELLKVRHIRDINDISLAHGVIHGYAPELVESHLEKERPHDVVNTRRNLLNLV